MRKDPFSTSGIREDEPTGEMTNLWIDRDGYITLHLTPDEAERIAYALPFDHELAVRIRRTLRGSLERNILY